MSSPPAGSWFVTTRGREYGPLTDEQLMRLAAERKLAPTDLVRRDNGPRVAASEVDGLFHTGAPTVPTASPIAPTAAPMRPAISAPAVHTRPIAPSRKSSFAANAVALAIGAAAVAVIYLSWPALEARILRKPEPAPEVDDEPTNAAAPAPMPAAKPTPAANTARVEPRTILVVTPTPTSAAPAPTAVATASPAPTQPVASAPEPSPQPMKFAPSVPGTEFTAARTDMTSCYVNVEMQSLGRKVTYTGLLIDDAGHVAMIAYPRQLPANDTKIHLLDGTSADVLGYSAALPGKQLLLLKTTAVGRNPQIALAPLPRLGDSLSSLRRMSSSVEMPGTLSEAGHYVVEEFTDSGTSKIGEWRFQPYHYDADAELFCASLKSGSPQGIGGAILDSRGAVAGFKVAGIPEGFIYVLPARHLLELVAAKSPEVLPLEMLDSGVKFGEARVYTRRMTSPSTAP